MLLEPFEDFKAGDFGHFEIEEQKRWNWKTAAVSETIRAPQITDGPLAVWNVQNGTGEACLLKGAPEKKDIVGIIISHKDCGLRTHNGRIATGFAGSRQLA